MIQCNISRDGRRPLRLLRSIGFIRAEGQSGKQGVMRALWMAVLVAVLLAYSWQSFLVQTHRHLDGARTAASAGADGVQRQNQSPDQPANCFLCRELAHAGHVVLPAPVVIEAPVVASFWLAVILLAGLSLSQRSHAWRSRAPPIRLQA